MAGYRGTSTQEKSEMPAAAAPYVTVIPRKFLTVLEFDHRTFDSIKKMMHVSAYNSETVVWA